jgi:hypothetical protein
MYLLIIKSIVLMFALIFTIPAVINGLNKQFVVWVQIVLVSFLWALFYLLSNIAV